MAATMVGWLASSWVGHSVVQMVDLMVVTMVVMSVAEMVGQ